MMQPTFVGIGAQKCASSWIYDILSDHPEVVVSHKKELDFFTDHYDFGYSWYEDQFVTKVGAKAVGEISPSYFHEASVPSRVKRYLPQARILVSLRDPVERALSQHRHQVRIGVLRGPDYSFGSGLASNPSYVEQGLYATHLSRWLDAFPRSQLHIVLMEDIRQDSEAVARKVYDFLSISGKHRSVHVNEKSNPSYALRYHHIGQMVQNMRNSAKRIGAGQLWCRLGDTGLRKLYRSFNRTPSRAVIPDPEPETLLRLREEYADEVKSLEKILGRSLSGWLPK